jgi:hypothetical protein
MKLLWLLLPAILLGIFLSSPAKAAVPPLGSQANPIPLSEPAQRIFDGYVPPGSVQDAYSHGGWVVQPPPRGSILWFVIDPYAVLGGPAQSLGLSWKWREGWPSISYIQNKATGEYAPGISLEGLQIYYDNNPYDVDKYRFLWGFENYADGDVAMKWSIWATINPSVAPAPLGSKTNPIPINKWNGGRSLIYYPSTATGNPNPASTPLAVNQKIYFVADSAVTGKTISKFYFTVMGFNNVDLFYTKVVQDKAGNDLSAEVTLLNNGGDTFDQVINNMPYNFDTTRFLYAIEDRSGNFGPPDVWVQFMP